MTESKKLKTKPRVLKRLRGSKNKTPRQDVKQDEAGAAKIRIVRELWSVVRQAEAICRAGMEGHRATEKESPGYLREASQASRIKIAALEKLWLILQPPLPEINIQQTQNTLDLGDKKLVEGYTLPELKQHILQRLRAPSGEPARAE